VSVNQHLEEAPTDLGPFLNNKIGFGRRLMVGGEQLRCIRRRSYIIDILYRSAMAVEFQFPAQVLS
jgi:hypothetical protein